MRGYLVAPMLMSLDKKICRFLIIGFAFLPNVTAACLLKWSDYCEDRLIKYFGRMLLLSFRYLMCESTQLHFQLGKGGRPKGFSLLISKLELSLKIIRDIWRNKLKFVSRACARQISSSERHSFWDGNAKMSSGGLDLVCRCAAKWSAMNECHHE